MGKYRTCKINWAVVTTRNENRCFMCYRIRSCVFHSKFPTRDHASVMAGSFYRLCAIPLSIVMKERLVMSDTDRRTDFLLAQAKKRKKKKNSNKFRKHSSWWRLNLRARDNFLICSWWQFFATNPFAFVTCAPCAWGRYVKARCALDASALKFRTSENRDVSTGPLACPFAWSLSLLTQLLALLCSARIACALRYAHSFVDLLIHSLPRSWENERMSWF